jgi:hypothetical protein
VPVLDRAEPLPEPVVALAIPIADGVDVRHRLEDLLDAAQQWPRGDPVEVEVPQVAAVVIEVVGEVDDRLAGDDEIELGGSV